MPKTTICTLRQCWRRRVFAYELITEFTYKIIIEQGSSFSEIGFHFFERFKGYIEIAHADLYVPSMPVSKVVKEELSDEIDRRIFVFERTSQFELLTRNTDTFMWVSPIPQSLLDRYNLVQKDCTENRKIYKDLLIYKNGYKLSKLDRQFITCLTEAKADSNAFPDFRAHEGRDFSLFTLFDMVLSIMIIPIITIKNMQDKTIC